MHHLKPVKSPKIAYINRQYFPDAVDIHARRQSSVMDLHALNVVRHQQRAPAVVYLAAVRKKLEIPFDHARKPVGLGNGQAEAVLLERACRGVPEFAECLGCLAQAHPANEQRFQGLHNDGVLRIIALANAQKNVAVEKTGISLGHQS